MIIDYDYWGYPIYATESEEQWASISHDWDIYDRECTLIRLHNQSYVKGWMHDENRAMFVLYEMDNLSETPFEAKSSRHIRAEKTRDYRKKRPKAQRYSDHIVPCISVLACLLGGQS